MSEHFSMHPEIQQINAAQQIGQEALAVIDHTYGNGYPCWSAGTTPLAFHNGHHGRKVGTDGKRVASQLDLSPVDIAITEAAGNAHDIIQLKGRGIDEAESAQWLAARMVERSVFLPTQRRIGELAILGTLPLFEDGRLVGQRATEQEYPNRTAELVAKSVASGDLGGLYTPEGPLHGHLLFQEIKGMPPAAELPFEEIIPFQRNQVALIEGYRYPLAEAETALATHRSEVTAYSHATLEKLERGDITSWDQLIQADMEFMRAHQ